MAVLDDTYTINDAYWEQKGYVNWLESFTIDERIGSSDRRGYSKLIRQLWKIPYRSDFKNDKDRGAEGLELRRRYEDILARELDMYPDEFPDIIELYGECRVLEMLVALSMHMYDIMQDTGEYNSVSRWFWEMMENVGLGYLDDIEFSRSKYANMKNVERKINDILYRNTRGTTRTHGFFGLEDWSETELWYQMHEYLRPYFE